MASSPSSDMARNSWSLLAIASILSVAAYGIVGYLHFEGYIPAYQLLDDPTDYAGVKWYTGLVSNLVVLLWCVSSTVCAFAGLVLRGNPNANPLHLSRFLLVMAVANLWMLVDDLWLVHEQVARLVFGKESQHTGEGLIFIVYAALVGTTFWHFRETIRTTQYLLLLVAIGSLGLSMAIDVSFQLELDGRNTFRETVLSVSWGANAIDIAEEILKLNGALLWIFYFAQTSYRGVRSITES